MCKHKHINNNIVDFADEQIVVRRWADTQIFHCLHTLHRAENWMNNLKRRTKCILYSFSHSLSLEYPTDVWIYYVIHLLQAPFISQPHMCAHIYTAYSFKVWVSYTGTIHWKLLTRTYFFKHSKSEIFFLCWSCSYTTNGWEWFSCRSRCVSVLMERRESHFQAYGSFELFLGINMLLELRQQDSKNETKTKTS